MKSGTDYSYYYEVDGVTRFDFSAKFAKIFVGAQRITANTLTTTKTISTHHHGETESTSSSYESDSSVLSGIENNCNPEANPQVYWPAEGEWWMMRGEEMMPKLVVTKGKPIIFCGMQQQQLRQKQR